MLKNLSIYLANKKDISLFPSLYTRNFTPPFGRFFLSPSRGMSEAKVERQQLRNFFDRKEITKETLGSGFPFAKQL